MDDVLELTGTISALYPIESDNTGNLIQKVILDNVTAINSNINITSRVLLIVRVQEYVDPIEFSINSPITAKGVFSNGSANFLPTLHTIHAPTGFIRYNSKVYR